MKHSPGTEAKVRIDLAAAYRLSAQRGWDDTIYTHLSAAVPGVSAEIAALTYRQWIGDGSQIDGDLEWPALLRGLDQLSPDYRD